MKKNVFIYGDSIMRATVLDCGGQYHATVSHYLPGFENDYRIENRSRFGCTVTRGSQIIKGDLDSGARPDIAVLCYGGNDCNYDWAEVAAAPDARHEPATPLPQFCETLITLIKTLRGHNIKPVLMTLPPISSEKYLAFLGSKGLDTGNIVKWLGSADMIYRFHELYSDSIARIAKETGCDLVDVRGRFLSCRDFDARIISHDGLHLKPAGYEMIASAFKNYAGAIIRGATMTDPHAGYAQ